jgi:general nucleoside transport system ATP-binding protein
MAGAPPLLKMRGITRHFGAVLANDRVDFELAAGEIHALLGENGAGKTTLVNILDGIYEPDGGEIEMDGRSVRIRSPREASRLGIGMIHQHFMLVETLTVVENVALSLGGPGFRLDRPKLRDRIRATASDWGLDIDPDAPVYDLSVGEQQRVEILKTLVKGACLLILDEPTAVLTPKEAEDLARILRCLRAEGRGIVYISHKLEEILALCDRVTVLRHGRVEGTFEVSGVSVQELARRMIGREPDPSQAGPRAGTFGTNVLSVEDLGAWGQTRGVAALRGVSLTVAAGEILGVAGVAGNGQHELAEVITGMRQPRSGRVLLDGKDLAHCSVAERARRGLRHIPADRLGTGLIPSLSVVDNVALRSYRQPPLARGPFLDHAAACDLTERLLARFDVACADVEAPIGALSGGNLQKVLVAREVDGPLRLLVAEYPSRGLDVGAAAFVHRVLLEVRNRGCAILFIGEDLDELCALSDRVLVMYGGRVAGFVPASEADPVKLGLWMAGQGVTG